MAETSTETAYISLEINGSEQDIGIYVDSISWINKCVLYLPMWARFNAQNQPRNKSLSVFMTIITIILMFTATAGRSYLYTASETSNGMTITSALYLTVFYLQVIVYVTARFYSMHYFYHKFNYPWQQKIDRVKITQHQLHISRIKFYNKFTKWILFTIIVMESIWESVDLFLNDSIIEIMDSLCDWTQRISIWWPLYVTIAVHSIICLKYVIYLNELISIIKQSDTDTNIIDINDLFEKYESIYEQMKKDFDVGLTRSIQLLLLASFLFGWIQTEFVFSHHSALVDIPTSATYIIIVAISILYTIPSTFVSELFVEFEHKLLWKIGKEVRELNDSKQYDVYNHFIHIVSKYPLVLKFGTFEITKRNCIKFVVVFVVARLLSFSMRFIVSQ